MINSLTSGIYEFLAQLEPSWPSSKTEEVPESPPQASPETHLGLPHLSSLSWSSPHSYSPTPPHSPRRWMHLVLIVVITQLCSYFYRCLIRYTGEKMKSKWCIFLNIYSKNKFSNIQSSLLSSSGALHQHPFVQQWPEELCPRRWILELLLNTHEINCFFTPNSILTLH